MVQAGPVHTGLTAAPEAALPRLRRAPNLPIAIGFGVRTPEPAGVASRIADAAVVGIPDERAGEVPKAFVVACTPVSPEELMAYVAARVAVYKQIRDVVFVDTIPVSPSGKILRRLLAQR